MMVRRISLTVLFCIIFVLIISFTLTLNHAGIQNSNFNNSQSVDYVMKINTVENYEFTFTSQATSDRIIFFQYLIKRWNGPFSIAITCLQKDMHLCQSQIKNLNLPTYFTVTYYTQSDRKTYPINILRNLAIKNVQTTHLWLADIDIWPSPDIYDRLQELPTEYLRYDKNALIIPVFEYNSNKVHCRTFAECASKMDMQLPSTKESLNYCLKVQKCSRFRPKQYLHNYYFEAWHDLNYSPLYTQLKCFKGNRQEPYIIVKKIPKLPLFDERFQNYGYNKVQWIENLRYFGYNFSVFTNGYGIDVPHPKSGFQKSFVNEIYKKKGKNITTEVLYKTFLVELKHNFTDHSVIRKC